MNGTPKVEIVEIPGWYINFLAAVIKQLPRPGQLDQTTAEGWEKNQEGLKNTLAGSLLPPAEEPKTPAKPQPHGKFEFLKAIKVTVPADYEHSTRLKTFSEQNRKKFHYYNDLITDENFAKVTKQLVPGKTYTVKILGIISGEMVTSKECLAKYREEKALLVGAQGASLVFEQKRNQLPKGKWYASFDEKDKLPVADGYHRVPRVHADSDGDFDFSLGYFEGGWDDDYCLLLFCDEQSSVA